MSRLILLLLVVSAGVLGAGLWIPLKALVAQELLTLAWAESEARQAQIRPWPWADTWPAARLALPAEERPMVVLAGAHGESLAFGPGLVVAGERGRGPVVIAGHRDTHFRALKELSRGAQVRLQHPGGRWQGFQVVGTRVVDSRYEMISTADLAEDVLLLVTCYPFDSVDSNGPLRYVVEARVLPHIPAGSTPLVTVAGQ